MRQLLRDMLILVGLLRIDGINPLEEQAPLTIDAAPLLRAALRVPGGRGAGPPHPQPAGRDPQHRRPALRLTAAPPRILLAATGHRLLRFSVPTTAGLLVTAITTDAYWGGIGLGRLPGPRPPAAPLYLGTWLLPRSGRPSEQQVLDWLDDWLAEYRPTVGMYFSGGASSAYQANMWLSTLAAAGRQAGHRAA